MSEWGEVVNLPPILDIIFCGFFRCYLCTETKKRIFRFATPYSSVVFLPKNDDDEGSNPSPGFVIDKLKLILETNFY